MPNPSQVRAQDINTELGVPTTTIVRLSNNWVKNIASTGSTSNSNINYGKIRWGINFPGGDLISGFVISPATNYYKTYESKSSIDLNGTCSIIFDGFTTANADCQIVIASGGLLTYSVSGCPQGASKSVTWLTSGVNSDYTARIDLDVGSSFDAGSSNTETDLSLSTTRVWTKSLGLGPGVGFNSVAVSGNLIIKSGGSTLINRPFTFSVTVSVDI